MATLREAKNTFEEIASEKKKALAGLRARRAEILSLAGAEESSALFCVERWMAARTKAPVDLDAYPASPGRRWSESCAKAAADREAERSLCEAAVAAAAPEALASLSKKEASAGKEAAAASAAADSLEPAMSAALKGFSGLGVEGTSAQGIALSERAGAAGFFARLFDAKLRKAARIGRAYAADAGRPLAADVAERLLPALALRGRADSAARAAAKERQDLERGAADARQRLSALPSDASIFSSTLSAAARANASKSSVSELRRRFGDGPLLAKAEAHLSKAENLKKIDARFQGLEKATSGFLSKIEGALPKLSKGARKAPSHRISIDLDAIRKGSKQLSAASSPALESGLRAARAISSVDAEAACARASEARQPGFDGMDALILAMAFSGDPQTAAVFGFASGHFGSALAAEALSFSSEATAAAAAATHGGIGSGGFDSGLSIRDVGSFSVPDIHVSVPDVGFTIPDISVPDVTVPDFSTPSFDAGSSFDSGSSF